MNKIITLDTTVEDHRSFRGFLGLAFDRHDGGLYLFGIVCSNCL